MGILWLSYGYPMVKVGWGQVKRRLGGKAHIAA